MNEYASSPPDISQQSDYIVLQISQEAIQNCDTSEYVTLLHGITDSLQSFEAAFQRYVLSVQVMIMTRESCTRYLRWSAS